MLDKFKWFWKYYKEYPYILFVLLILTPVQAAIQVTIPRIIEFTVDFAKSGVVPDNRAARLIADWGTRLDISTAAAFALALLGIGLISFTLYAYVQSHRGWMNLKMEWLFRQDAFNGITRKGPDFFNKFRTGDVVTRLTDDVAEKLSWFACSGIFRFYEAVLMVIFTAIMMVIIDPVLTLWTAGPLPILIIIFFKSSSLLEKRYDKLQKSISRFNDVMEACFSGIRVVKAYSRENSQRGKFDQSAQARRSAEISAVKATVVVDSLYMYIWQFGIIIAIFAGGYMVIKANLTLGKLMAFIYYVIYLVFPMFDIGQFLVKSRQSGVSIERLKELDSIPPMVTDSGESDANNDFHGEIKFENVDFGFDSTERKILDNINLEVHGGETVAVVGKIGAGKSWLVNMVPRFVDPTGGRIAIGGQDIRDAKLGELRESIGYVPQEPTLFSDTVENNIRFGRDEISDETLNWAIDIAQLRDDISTFPKGTKTLIGHVDIRRSETAAIAGQGSGR